MSYYDRDDRDRGGRGSRSRSRDRGGGGGSDRDDRDGGRDIESGGGGGGGGFIMYAFVAYDTKILAECVSPLRGNNSRQDALIERAVALAHKVLRRIIRKTEDHKKTFVSDKFSFHYIMERGLVYLTVTQVDHPQRLAFAFLRDVKTEWNRQYTYRECVSAPPSHMTSEFVGTFRKKMIHYSEQGGGGGRGGRDDDYDDRGGRGSSRGRDDRDWDRGRGRDDRDYDYDRDRGRGRDDRDSWDRGGRGGGGMEMDDFDAHRGGGGTASRLKEKLRSADPTDNKFCRNARLMCWLCVVLVLFMMVAVYITGYFICHGFLWQNCFGFLFSDYI